MYVTFGIFFLILLFFFCINHWRRKKIICKINHMHTDEKCEILNELIEPFGFCYLVSQDIFTSRTDAWQRNFGYSAFYDRSAPRFHLIYDCLPVYFDYNGRTWLIEFWKGQYGINTGSEIGVYYADRILNQTEYAHTLFQSVSNEDMLDLSFNLFKNGMSIANVCGRHWWLTAFSMGRFSRPVELYMRSSITFPDALMAKAFIRGLINTGYCRDDIYLFCNTVTFSFSEGNFCCGCRCRFLRCIQIRIAQWINRFWCRIYLFITRPFCLSLDRILYLYYYLPISFRKMFRIRKYL